LTLHDNVNSDRRRARAPTSPAHRRQTRRASPTTRTDPYPAGVRQPPPPAGRVEDDDVHVDRVDELQRARGVGRLGHDLDVLGRFLDRRAHQVAHVGMVVDDHQAHRRAPSVTRQPGAPHGSETRTGVRPLLQPTRQ
jgi:hypothetical protein